MNNAIKIETSAGVNDSVNLSIFIPAEAWAALNNGQDWVGHEANGDVESGTINLNKVTIRLGG